MSNSFALWLGLVGTALQLVGSVMTLWGLVSADDGLASKLGAIVGALVRSKGATFSAAASSLNPEDRVRVLQGLAVLALGYLLALVSQAWMML